MKDKVEAEGKKAVYMRGKQIYISQSWKMQGINWD